MATTHLRTADREPQQWKHPEVEASLFDGLSATSDGAVRFTHRDRHALHRR